MTKEASITKTVNNDYSWRDLVFGSFEFSYQNVGALMYTVSQYEVT